MRRRDVLTVTGGAVAALSGCLGRTETAPEHTPITTQPTDSPTEPAYTTCTSDAESSRAPESARDIPDSLTHETIVAYLATVERDIVLPTDDSGYVQIGEITTDAVAHGYLADVPVNGGYYNRPSHDNATETRHYDLPTHTARYFLTEQLVRRTEGRERPADPRTQGELIVCLTA